MYFHFRIWKKSSFLREHSAVFKTFEDQIEDAISSSDDLENSATNSCGVKLVAQTRVVQNIRF